MNVESLISIIIPVYNVEPFLVEALESAVCQTYNNLEIIIIDDDSDDGSGEICDEYASRDHRIFVIHQRNRGLSGARNSGLDFANGDAIAFLDSDDALHQDYIKHMFSAMVREKADIVVCKYSVHRTEGLISQDAPQDVRPKEDMGTYDRAEALRAFVDRSIHTTVWNKLYRRRLWNKIRFPVGHNYEDVDTLFRVLNKCGKCYGIQEPLYRYRIRGGSITNTPSWENQLDRMRAFVHLDLFIERHTPELYSTEQRNQI